MIDLDAAEALAREMAESPWLTVEDLDDLREVARSALALVAEVRSLRAEVSLVERGGPPIGLAAERMGP